METATNSSPPVTGPKWLESFAVMSAVPYWIWIAIAIAIGLWLRAPVLYTGFISDDYGQRAMLEGMYPVERSPLDLFSFSNGSSGEARILMDFGFYPWWSYEHLELEMFRPLASVMIVLDHWWLGEDAVTAHVHSLVWWTLLVCCVAMLLRTLLPKSVAAIAVLVFALDEGHAVAVGWLANRSALMALTFVVLGLWAHVRNRRDGWRAGRILAWVCFVLAAATGEWAISAMAYVFAFELFARGSLGARARALAPAAVPVLVYLLINRALGYGVAGSSVYLDPFRQSGEYLIEALDRIPIFFADLVFGVPSQWWSLGSPWRIMLLRTGWFSPELWRKLPDWRWWHDAIGVLGMILAVAVTRWGLRASRESHLRIDGREHLRWLLLGSALSLTPVVGSFPSSRLLLPAALGMSAMVGVVLVLGWQALSRPRPTQGWTQAWLGRAGVLLVGVFLAYVQIWQAGVRSRVEVFGDQFHFNAGRDWALRAEIDDDAIRAGQRLVIVSGLDHTTAAYVPFVRWFHGHPMPKQCFVLSSAAYAHDIHRISEYEIELAVLGGTFLENHFELLFRDEDLRFAVGDVIGLDGLDVHVVKVVRGKPQRVRFRFAHSLDGDAYRFLQSTPIGLRRIELPEVGERLRVPKAAIPVLLPPLWPPAPAPSDPDPSELVSKDPLVCSNADEDPNPNPNPNPNRMLDPSENLDPHVDRKEDLGAETTGSVDPSSSVSRSNLGDVTAPSSVPRSVERK